MAVAVVDAAREHARVVLGRRSEPPALMRDISALLAKGCAPAADPLRSAIDRDLQTARADPYDAVLAGLALMRRRTSLAVLAVLALGFSLYLTHIEKAVLEVYCLYCVISLGIIALLTLLSLGWAFTASRRT